MTKYHTQFEESTQTIGVNLAGWTLRGGGAPTRYPQYGLGTVLPVKRRYCAFTTDVTTDYHAVSLDVLDADANRATFDIVFGFAMSLATVEEIHVYARGAGTATMTDFIRARIVLGSGVIAIDKMVASAYTAGSGSSAGSTTLTAGHAYFGRLTGVAGAVSLKIWDATLGKAGEPTAYNLTPTGMTPTAAGWIGFGGRHTTLTAKVVPPNFFAVGTNGDAAVCPRTNTEFYDWVSKSNLRCVIADMMATGYDSAGSPYTKTINAYVANHGYNSHQQDTPSLQHYDNAIAQVPTFSRSMGAALVGASQVGFGDLVLKNPGGEVRGTTYLYMDGTTGSASTPDSATISITGDLDLRIKVSLDDWTPGTRNQLISKWTSAGNASWIFRVNTDGKLALLTSVDGTATTTNAPSTVASSITDGSIKWVRVTFDCDNGAAGNDTKFYTSEDYDPLTGTGTWTQLGATVTTAGTTSIFNSNAALQVGYNTSSGEPLDGRVYRAQVYSGIAGTLVSDFNLTNVVKGTTSFSAPTGEVWTINSSAQIRQNDDTVPGKFDDWLRARWTRNYLRMFIGDPTWPKHDFRPLMVGRLGMPTAPSLSTLKFPIADLGDFLNAPVTTSRFSVGSGIFENQVKPMMFGGVRCLELQFDPNTLEAQITDGVLPYDLNDANYRLYDCTAEAFVHIGGTQGTIRITAVDTGTETLTANTTHNLQAGYRVQLIDGTVGGLSTNTNYWVLAAGLTATDFRLTDTQGSLTAVDIAGAGSGSRHIHSYGYTFDVAAGTVTLISPLVGRAFLFDTMGVTGRTVTGVIEDIVDACGLSDNFKDGAAFTAAAAADVSDSSYGGYATHVGQVVTAKDAADAIANRCRAWYGFSVDGLLQTGAIALPAATAVKALTWSDVSDLTMGEIRRPVDFTKAVVTQNQWFPVGPLPIIPGVELIDDEELGQTSAELAAGNTTAEALTYGAAGVPLDDHPDYLDSSQKDVFNTLGGNIETRLKAFMKLPLGLPDVKGPLANLWHAGGPLSIGDTISLEHPRHGWKAYTGSGAASPDRTADYDARFAVVRGFSVNLAAAAGEQVTLQLYRPVPGYFATANLN